jgi:ADP-heptose:LPS heptosyltransferase
VIVDCRRFTGASPCVFHKLDGRPCAGCAEQERVAARILIVKLAAAGDVLRTTCILPAVRAAWPGSHITWVTERSAVALLEGNPLIDAIVPRDTALERLLVEEFDLVLGLDPDPAGGALAALARCRERRGYVLDDRGRVLPVNEGARHWWQMGLDDRLKRANRRTYPDLLHEICGLAPADAPPQLVVSDQTRRAVRARFAARLAPFDRALLLNTGGGERWAQKRWTGAHYLDFAQRVRREEPATAVLIAGGPNEADWNARLLAAAAGDPGIIDAGCRNTIKEFAAIVELADLTVTSDSLALHIATALARPAVVFVGPTSASEIELYGRGEIVHADVPCLGCYRRECDRAVSCMELLTVDEVYAACVRLRSNPDYFVRAMTRIEA